MNEWKNALATIVLSAASILFLPAATAGDQLSSRITTHAIHQADTEEAAQVRDWLIDHAVFVDSAQIGDLANLGDLHISHSRALDRSHASTSIDAPPSPAPLPAPGHVGDTFSVSTCSPGISQSWTYTWSIAQNGAQAWGLTEYIFRNAASCGAG